MNNVQVNENSLLQHMQGYERIGTRLPEKPAGRNMVEFDFYDIWIRTSRNQYPFSLTGCEFLRYQ